MDNPRSPALGPTCVQTVLTHPLTRTLQPFVIGCLSGCFATVCVQPMDLVKVHLQLLGEGHRGGVAPSPVRVARAIVAQRGLVGLYDGLSAALLRQVTYGTARLGFFFSFDQGLRQRAGNRGTAVTFPERAAAALLAGGLGAMVGTPAEVALVRMQSDGLRPAAERAHYGSAVDALVRTVQAEGVVALWKGASPTVIRAMSATFGQLALFSQTKHHLVRWPAISEQTRTVIASVVGGISAAAISMPFDFVKTRLQAPGTRYRGMADCFLQIVRVEGAASCYSGFTAYLLRMAPHSAIALFVADNLTRLLARI